LEKIIFHDQDILNVVLQDEKKLLPITYNFQTFFFCKNKFSEDFSCMVKKIIQERPIVLHFDGSIKVWNKQSKHPYLDYYLYYKKKSLWRKFPLVDNRTIKEKLISLRNELIWFWGLRKRITRYIIKRQKFKNKI
jgi:lipopolysaccharide biosynthesis glycosyltransferase